MLQERSRHRCQAITTWNQKQLSIPATDLISARLHKFEDLGNPRRKKLTTQGYTSFTPTWLPPWLPLENSAILEREKVQWGDSQPLHIPLKLLTSKSWDSSNSQLGGLSNFRSTTQLDQVPTHPNRLVIYTWKWSRNLVLKICPRPFKH